jgi:dynein heavy chain, axonemal
VIIDHEDAENLITLIKKSLENSVPYSHFDSGEVFSRLHLFSFQKCSKEAKAINTDEHLLQLDQSYFPAMTEMIEKMQPIEKLWRTAYHFDSCYETWYYGNFTGLDSDAIRDEVDDMWKTIHKLTKQLVSNPQAKRVADQIRVKIDKFKVFIPVLEAICQQGLNERHWALISEEMGMTINSELFNSLGSIVDLEIMKILPRLLEISNAAGKEHELNIQLITMQTEWKEVSFDLRQYRDTDTFLLAALDNVQALLDDHILKSQAMRGSPYIAALGAKATDWEDKLINMQDVLDTWLQVQSTWMYLEPIFSSEDIMRQMPTEGRNFKAIDKTWRNIMHHTHNDRRVLQATDYPNLLEVLKTSLEKLETIQKGLNMYLEKKRLFFARFFFLSNDELLEILSETKDAQRVQPHLKKCFEGVSRVCKK